MSWTQEQLWEWLTLALIQSRKGGDENQGLQPHRSQHEHIFHKLEHKYYEAVFAWENCFVLWTISSVFTADAFNPIACLAWKEKALQKWAVLESFCLVGTEVELEENP